MSHKPNYEELEKKVQELERAELERMQTEEELSQIFSMSLDPICIADINTATFIKVNPAFTEILGYSEEELFELLGAAKRFGKRYGVPVVSAMQSDVPGYTWGLASALAHHDVPYMSVGPNWFASGGPNDYFKEGKIIGRTHRGGRVFHWADQPFWWVSPSGSPDPF